MDPSRCAWSAIYCINAVITQHIKSSVLLHLVTFGYMFRPFTLKDFKLCLQSFNVNGIPLEKLVECTLTLLLLVGLMMAG